MQAWRAGLAVAAALLTAAAPAGPVPGAKEEAMSPEAPKLDGLVFAPGAGERHRALRAWLEARAAGWRHVPLAVHGNFVTERWCAPSVPAARCQSGAVVTEEGRGTAFAALETLHYPQEWPRVFGLVLSIVRIPEQGELGLRFHLSEDGRTVVGPGMEASFLRLEGERVAERLSLGARAGLRLVETELQVETPGGWRQALKRMAASPESLEEFALFALQALERRVHEALRAGEVQGYDEGEYLGGGVPPERTWRPLTTAEAERERAAALAELARRRAFVQKHARAMHALLRAHVPVEIL